MNFYSNAETLLVIQLKNDGLIGHRLSDEFKKVFPKRSHPSILNKVQQLRNKKVIR